MISEAYEEQLKEVEHVILRLASEFKNDYGMPESEAVHFRNRRMKVILEEYLESKGIELE